MDSLIQDWISDAMYNETTWNQEHELRKLHVKNVCKQLSIDQDINDEVMEHILVDKKHQALFCFVPKVVL